MNRIGKQARPNSDQRVQVGGVNIFKTLGHPDADAAFAKVELAYKTHMLIERKGLNQTQAAALLGTDRARVSNLMRGRLKEFSLERPFHFRTRPIGWHVTQKSFVHPFVHFRPSKYKGLRRFVSPGFGKLRSRPPS
jgi:predicted XRE-type DNA-binding protein